MTDSTIRHRLRVTFSLPRDHTGNNEAPGSFVAWNSYSVPVPVDFQSATPAATRVLTRGLQTHEDRHGLENPCYELKTPAIRGDFGRFLKMLGHRKPMT